MKKNIRAALLWIAVILPIASNARAAQPVPTARGFDHAKVYNLGNIDNINAQNGNLVLSIPLGMSFTAGDRLKFRFNLIYNSSLWDYEEHCAELASGDGDPMATGGAVCHSESVPMRDFNAGLGWRLSLGELSGEEEFTTPDGVKHTFYDSLHFAPPAPAEAGASYTRDNSYLRKRASGTLRFVDLPDGTTYTFDCQTTCNASLPRLDRKFRLTRIHDVYGNELRVTYGTPGTTEWVWTFEEKAGPGVTEAATTHTLRFVRRNNEAPYDWAVQSLTLAGPGGTNDTYQFSYTTGTVSRDMNHTAWSSINEVVQPGRCDPGEDCSLQLPLLTSVLLPNGAGTWNFQYEQWKPDDYVTNGPDFAGRSGKSRRLNRVDFPTGGSIEYRYGPYVFKRVRCEHRNLAGRMKSDFRATGVVERQMRSAAGAIAGVWRYALKNGKLYDYTPQSDEPESCDGVYEYWTEAHAPYESGEKYGARHVTLNYFHGASAPTHTSNHAEHLILQPRFHGLPFTPLRADPATSTRAAVDRRYLSTRTYNCTSSFDPAVEGVEGVDINGNVQVNAKCTAVRETWVRYEQDPAVCSEFESSACRDANSRVLETKVVYRDDQRTIDGVNVIAERTTVNDTFDGLGHYRKNALSGNFSRMNFPQQLPRLGDLRETETSYNPGVTYNPAQGIFTGLPSPSQNWILGNYGDRTVRDFAVDRNGVKSGGAVSTHVSEYDFDPATGYLRRQRLRRGANGTRTATDLVTQRSRSMTGGRFVEVESSHGGDGPGFTLPQGWNAPLSTIPLGDPEYVLVSHLEAGSVQKLEYARCLSFTGNSFLVLETNTVDGRTGLVTESRDTSGALTKYQYDSTGRLTRITPPGGETTSGDASTFINYAINPNTVQVTRAAGSQTLQTTTYLYDPFGRPSDVRRRVPTTAANTEESSTVTKYLPTGWTSEQSTAGPLSPSAFTRFLEFDAFGRAGRIRQADNTVRELTHTGERLASESIDGALSSRKFDSVGRLAQVIEELLSGPGDRIASDATYSYDSMDHVTTVKTAGQTSAPRRFEYDGAGLLMREWPVELAPRSLEYTYDARGNVLTRRVDTPGSTHDLEYLYDAAERLTAVFAIPPEGGSGTRQQLKSFTYHPAGAAGLSAGKLATASRVNIVRVAGALATTRKVDVREEYQYDSTTGRVRTRLVRIPAGPGDLQVRYGYDKLGNLNSLRYPCAGTGENCTAFAGAPVRTVAMTYKEGSFLTSVTGYATNMIYHLNGTLAELRRANGTTDVVGADPSGLPRPRSLSWAGRPARNFIYDGRGNILQFGTDVFSYDGASRLTSATVSGVAQTYGYDRNGNLLSVNGSVFPVDAATNRLSAGDYDPAGRMKSYPDVRPNTQAPLSYEWDRLDRMTHSTAAGIGRIFLYDANDERVGVIDYALPENLTLPASEHAARELWTLRGPGNLVLRELEARRPFDATKPVTWKWIRDYVYRGSSLLASISPNASGADQVRHLHLDHLGTPRLMTNATGQLAAESPSRDYQPFGPEIRATPNVERLKFTGHERDDNGELGVWGDLDSMHARYYAPFLGRFVSMDPDRSSAHPDLPQSWNRYNYALNNPIRFVDVQGMTPSEPATVAPDVCDDDGCTITVTTTDPAKEENYGLDYDRGGKRQVNEHLGPFDNWVKSDFWESAASFTHGFMQPFSLGTAILTEQVASEMSPDFKRKAELVDQQGVIHTAGNAAGLIAIEILTGRAGGPPAPPKPKIRAPRTRTTDDGRLIVDGVETSIRIGIHR